MAVALIWKRRTSGLPSWSKGQDRVGSRRLKLPQIQAGGDGPGILFFLVALVVVAVAGARFLGFAPELDLETGQRVSGPAVVAEQGEEPSSRSQPGDLGVPVTSPSGSPAMRVIVYHAHGSENYRPNPPHTRGGRPGDVVKVGAELAEALRREGFAVEHVTRVFDHPQWSEAFQRAGDELARLLDAHQDVAALIDVHRDATSAEVAATALRTRVAGTEAARILLVVGEADNPYADRNTAFAEALKNKLDARLPGLSRGVRLHTNNYNGHLHPRSLQVFIGDYEKTTLEQAVAAARLLAPVLAEVLKETAQ